MWLGDCLVPPYPGSLLTLCQQEPCPLQHLLWVMLHPQLPHVMAAPSIPFIGSAANVTPWGRAGGPVNESQDGAEVWAHSFSHASSPLQISSEAVCRFQKKKNNQMSLHAKSRSFVQWEDFTFTQSFFHSNAALWGKRNLFFFLLLQLVSVSRKKIPYFKDRSY